MIQLFRFFFRHPTLGILGLLLSFGLGIFGLDRLQIQLMPDYRVDYATVTATWPGVSVEGMDEKVGKHLDQAVRAVTGVNKAYTTSSEGYVNIYLELDHNTNIDATLDRIDQKIASLTELPNEMETPKLIRYDASERIGRMIIFGIKTQEGLLALKDRVTEELQQNGISHYSISGADQQRMLIEVDPVKSREVGISLSEIDDQLKRSLTTHPTFTVTQEDAKQYVVRSNHGEFTGMGEIRLGPKWNGLKLKDIANIRRDEKPSLTRNVFRRGEGIFVQFRRGPEENIVKLTQAIEKVARNLEAELSPAISVELYGMEAYQIQDRITLLAKNGLMGLALVVFVLYLFVGLQTAFWVGIGIPSTFALSFLFMSFSGQSINMVSVFTMVMVVGILVDDSIVVAEGITSNRSTEIGVQRTWSPVFTATLTTLAAFAPILLLTDQIGTYVAAIPWFVCAALLASLIECFVLLPNHMHHDSLLSKLPMLPGRKLFGRLYQWFLTRLFKWFLNLNYRFPSFIIVSSLVLIIVSGGILATGSVRFQFWLNPQSNFVFAHVTVPSSQDTELLEMVFDDIWMAADAASEKLSYDETTIIQTTFAIMGQHYTRRGTVGQSEKGSVLLELKDQGGSRIEPRQFLKMWQSFLPDQSDGVSIEIEERLQGLEGTPISISLNGPSLEELRVASQTLVQKLNSTNGLNEARANLAGRNLEFSYGISPLHKILGVSPSEVHSNVAQALNGEFAAQVLPEGEEIEWQIRYKVAESIRKTLETVPIVSGNSASLADAIDVTFERGLTQIKRRDGQISIEVTAYNDSEVLSLDQARSLISEQYAPQIMTDYNVKIDQKGHVRTQDKTMQQVALAFALGLALIYCILSLTMRSFATPLLIMGILPFGAVGMVLGHYILDYTLTLLSIVALVGLFGVLVNDSILLFDEIRRQRTKLNNWREAVHQGYSRRLRAILLTSITTIFGLLPLLLETSYQAQFLVPIAITISFGLGLATLVTLFLVPAIVSIITVE